MIGRALFGTLSTGDGVVPTDALIHEFYAHECVNPVHVTLDVNFTARDAPAPAPAPRARSLDLHTHSVFSQRT